MHSYKGYEKKHKKTGGFYMSAFNKLKKDDWQ